MALLVFDFDGTLVDSNVIKREAYFEAVAAQPKLRALLDGVMTRGAAGDRRAIFTLLATEAGDAALADALVARYTVICRDAVFARLADGWAADFLDRLAVRGHRVYVNSATPADALGEILDASGLVSRLAGYRGGFGRKTANLRSILADEDANAAIVVGDGEDDARSAAECGCPFLRVNDREDALFRMPPDGAVRAVESAAAALAR